MILITGGGTGGHLSTVDVLGDALWRRGAALVYVGSTRGQDQAWFGDDARFAARYFLATIGIVDRTGLARAAAVGRVLGATFRAVGILRRHHVRAVLSVGAYPAAPACLAALLTHVPLFLHEHNVVMGALHRRLRRRARAIFDSYDERSPVRDYPVAPAFFARRRLRQRVARVLVLGGSQGARFLNDLGLACAPALARRSIAITHQTGVTDFERVRAAYERLGVAADVFAFDRKLADRMASADVAVSRAGATTLWELTANGLPALFVPYPFAGGDHQHANASFLADKGLAAVARQDAATPELVLDLVARDVAPLSAGLMTLIAPGGADAIADHVLAASGLAPARRPAA